MSDKDTKKQYIKEQLLKRESEAKTVRKIVLISVASILVLCLAGALGGYFYIQSALKPVDPGNEKVTKVTIPIGSSVSGISNILEDKGIIKDARVFRYYTKFKNESGFQAGEYEFSPSMKLNEITASLKTGKVMQSAALKITIPEGKQLDQIAGILAEKAKLKKQDVWKTLNDKAFIKKMQSQYPQLLKQDIYGKNIKYPLEGYLFPATYSYHEKHPTVEDLITPMLEKQDEILLQYRDSMAKKKLSPHKLLTMASLIEEEATEKTHRESIASVFYNRLETGMPLQTDPTVLYAKGSHQKRVLYKDLEVKSPYNTYQNTGLPPGPIANAGTSSIEAALNPSDTKYLYFLAASDGKVYFSKSLEEHNKLKAEHITNKK
ncbi:endolytic transglycosylase MltG [Peribacillus deserti]|uniref:Endolytic murein transglycosylase n=1 Tax=Peribacillus deserti TaxID=673318 RepID=A0A2N5M980_9BACI|nr:endolytic transglycosylase MltG [Peribacillus deserti]PLT30902.1 endolytic transglycosylase MltG [Peribacillus deserti]